jgi:hypothetical protein
MASGGDLDVRRWIRMALALALWIGPPAAVSLILVGSGVPAVLQTGMCPPAPPDIPSYPCTAFDYLMRMTVSPFALVGHIAIGIAWTALLGGLLAIGWLVRVLWNA